MTTIQKAGVFCWPLILLAAISAAQQIKYTNANNGWNADSLGNHRAVVVYTGTGKMARVVIEWRRRDNNPEAKEIIVQDAKTGQQVTNMHTASINREYVDLYFEPVSGSGKYYVYYMPYRNEGRSNYPKGVYLQPVNTASASWLNTIPAAFKPNAFCSELQSINAFNGFYPMEVIATAKETDAVRKKYATAAMVVFPEDRMHPIRMKTDLPQRWITKGASDYFAAVADKGENFAFQLGIYALQELQDLQVVFSDLKNAGGAAIAAKDISCINTGGMGYNNVPIKNKITVAAGTVQALWCTLRVPLTITAGLYTGTATIKIPGGIEKKINLSITVSNHDCLNHGVNEPAKMTRLAWLNSDLAQQNEVIAPYTALQVDNNTISLLGRKMELNNDGFPKQIQTFFTEEMTGLTDQPNNLFVPNRCIFILPAPQMAKT